MASITDDRGYNQGFKPTRALAVRTERRLLAILAEMQPRPGASVLELGCGTGELSALLAAKTQARVVGLDICEPFIRTAAEKYSSPNLTFQVLDLTQTQALKTWGQTFDYIVGNGILHHLYRQLPAVLANLKLILKPQGRLIFWEPNLCNPYVYAIFTWAAARKWARLEPGEMAFTRAKMAAALKQAGFQDLKISYRDFLAPNTPAALIKPVVYAGKWAEKIPGVKNLAQSLFISAGVESRRKTPARTS